ncbi:hypothetical protein BPC006_II0761 [Burkholderia pseudomallei BPC006]|nr:hypothetical protein BPC006_II0761 [Burkholderia pseudomallei BPC006]
MVGHPAVVQVSVVMRRASVFMRRRARTLERSKT